MITEIILGAVAAALVAGLIANNRRRPPGSGITEASLPLYVRRSMIYCRMFGYPENEWRRFEHRAIADLIMEIR